MLKLMEGKHLAKRTTRNGQLLWVATVTHQETRSSFLQNIAETLFGGSFKLLVSHLLEQGELSKKEQAEITELLKQSAGKKKRKV